LRIWDVATGDTRRTLEGHTEWVQGCGVAPDGTWIVSASNDKTLRIWDAATGESVVAG
jgi:WD40 repeat protein